MFAKIAATSTLSPYLLDMKWHHVLLWLAIHTGLEFVKNVQAIGVKKPLPPSTSKVKIFFWKIFWKGEVIKKA